MQASQWRLISRTDQSPIGPEPPASDFNANRLFVSYEQQKHCSSIASSFSWMGNGNEYISGLQPNEHKLNKATWAKAPGDPVIRSDGQAMRDARSTPRDRVRNDEEQR